MILVDTNVLIGLVDEEDQLHAKAIDDAARLAGKGLFVITPVLTEACFALSRPYERSRLRRLLTELQMKLVVLDEAICEDVFAWMDRYAEHRPDFADACLAVLCGRDKHLKVWTYDREFSTVWKRPDGTSIPQAAR